MSEDDPIAIDGEETSREDLERQADDARARLMTTLDVLDRRRHDAFDVKAQLQAHFAPIVGALAVGMLLVGALIGVAIHDAIDRRHHKNRDRFRAFARIWRHPDRAMRTEKRSFLGEIGRRVALSALTVLATQLTSHAVKRALGPRTT